MSLIKKFWTILAITVIVTACLFTQIPNNAQAGQEVVEAKVRSALRDIAGIDVNKYNITVISYRSTPIPGDEASYRGEEDIQLRLESRDNRLSVIAQYLNNRIVSMNLRILEGSPSTIHYTNKLSSDPVVATREFLYRLKTFTGNPSIVEMQQIFETVDNLEMANKTVGNIECRVTIPVNPVNRDVRSSTVKVAFIYAWNGIGTQRNLGIRFEDGLFSGFGDSWDMYLVADVDVTISREQAINVAREQAIAT
ncbi:MAG: hypothetical protein FWD52_05445 [Candidatus Bathyarchaeota archaeon]|nr:hypothetical protein [Candidatus Termiticorpusculum sp.]